MTTTNRIPQPIPQARCRRPALAVLAAGLLLAGAPAIATAAPPSIGMSMI